MKKITYLLFLLVTVSLVAQNNQASLQVAGKAIVKEIPREIVFRIPLKIVDSSYISCNDRMVYTLNELQKDLKKKGIAEESIQTGNYSITENMVFEGGKRVQQGFQGSVNVLLSATYSPQLIQKVLESVSSFKLNYTINFSMSEEQKQRLTEIAMVSAVEDAKQKAMILAKAANVQLGSILKISYGIDQYRTEPMLSERIMSSQADEMGQNELNLSPSMTSLFKSVLIVWEIQ
jgi:uncharacterized protein YggE